MLQRNEREVRWQNKLINLDTSATAILSKSKSELQETAKSLVRAVDKLTEYEALYKLQFPDKRKIGFSEGR